MPEFDFTKEVRDLAIQDCADFRNMLTNSPNILYETAERFNKWYFLLPPSLEEFPKDCFGNTIKHIVELTEVIVKNNQKEVDEIKDDVRKHIWLRFTGELLDIKKGLLRLHLVYMGIDSLDSLDKEDNNFLHYLSRSPIDIQDIVKVTLPDIYSILGNVESKIDDLYGKPNIYGEIPIFAATLSAQQNNVEQYLIEMGARNANLDIKEIKTNNDDNLLHYATLSANKEFAGYVKQLVGNDAVQQSEFTRLENKDGLSSLDYFYFITHDETQGKLKSYAIDPDTLLNRSKRLHYISKVAHRLAQLKSPALLRYFIEKYKLDINNCNRYDANGYDSGDTLLHTAALYASLHTVAYLVYHGAKVDKHNGHDGERVVSGLWMVPLFKNSNGDQWFKRYKSAEYPLHFAAFSGDKEKYEFLLKLPDKTIPSVDDEILKLYRYYGGCNEEISVCKLVRDTKIAIDSCLNNELINKFNPSLSDVQIAKINKISDRSKKALVVALLYRSETNNNSVAHLPLMYLKYIMDIDISSYAGIDVFSSDFFTNFKIPDIEEKRSHFLCTAVLNYYYSIVGFDSITTELVKHVKFFDHGIATNCRDVFSGYKGGQYQ